MSETSTEQKKNDGNKEKKREWTMEEGKKVSKSTNFFVPEGYTCAKVGITNKYKCL